jgi:hypothetical protein
MWPISPLNQALLIATALLTLALGASILHGRVLKAELGEKTAEIDYMRRVATEYSERSEQTAKEINDGIPKLVEQAKASAVANYKKRYGVGNAACGIRTDSLLTRHKDGVGEAVSTEVADGVPQPEFISACASDAAVIEQWQQWARLNQLPVE